VAAATFDSLNPATGEVIESFPRSTAADVDRAVATARTAWEEWRLVPAPERGNVLFRFAELLRREKPALSDLMTREMGKVKAEAGGDVQEAIDMSYYMGGEGRRLFGHTTPSELPDKFMMSVRMPVGVVGAITPWNFPIAIPAWKLCPALVCGNTVVLKPAEDTPLLAQRFVDLLREAGLPDGVVQVVHGFGEEAGDALVRHPDVPVITFTGSRETGVLVTKAAADRLKHVHLELGGKNAIIVLDDADLDLAVDGICWSAFGTAGQRCTAASRVIVQRGVYDELQRRLVARAERMILGAPWEDATEIGPVINKAAVDKIHSYTEIGKAEGAKLLTGGEPVEGAGFYYRPTVFAEVEPGMRIAQEEIFGPTTALIPVDTFEDAVRAANAVEYGLSSSIFTRDVNRAFKAMRDLQTGITYVNAGTTGAEVHLPFGGMKQTGNGHREAGQAALDVFTEWKSIYVDYSGRLQRAQIDNAERPAPR
jgi:aldehyde dehydrogenase (NAD+)